MSFEGFNGNTAIYLRTYCTFNQCTCSGSYNYPRKDNFRAYRIYYNQVLHSASYIQNALAHQVYITESS